MHHHAIHRFAGEALGRGQPNEFNAFFFGIRHFTLAARHVGAVAAVQAFHADSALPGRGSYTIHRSVTTADHHHALAIGVQLAAIKLRHLIAKALAVAGGQIVDGAHHTGGPYPRRFHVARFVDSGGDQNGIMLPAKGVEAHIHTHGAIQRQLHTGLFQLFDPLHHHRLFQLEPGDAIGQQPPGTVIAVIDRDLHPLTAQEIGSGQPAGTGTDDAHRFRAFRHRADRLHPALFPGGVGKVFFNRANRHSAVAGLFDHAIAFAQPVLRADAAADLGKCVGGLGNLVGLLQAALRGHPQPVGDVVVQRAMGLAVGHAALAAAAGLVGGLAVGILAVNLAEILGA